MSLKSCRAKGNKNRRKVIDYLEAQGWLVDVVEKTGKFVKVKDLYGLFDLIAIYPNRTKLIQVKSNVFPTNKAYLEFQQQYQHIEVETWCWKDRKGFTIRTYVGGKTHDESID